MDGSSSRGLSLASQVGARQICLAQIRRIENSVFEMPSAQDQGMFDAAVVEVLSVDLRGFERVEYGEHERIGK